MKHSQWRDCQAWRDEGLPLSTTSNEAAKLYDACLTQFVGWYDDSEFGGLGKSCELMHNADPEFVLGLVFNLGVHIVGVSQSIFTNPDIRKQYEVLEATLEKQKTKLTSREILHAKAMLLWGQGHTTAAARMWEGVLVDFPTDMYALKMTTITYFYNGNFQQLRDSPARVLPIWEAKRPPLTSYIYSLYSFGLVETNQFEKAERFARMALDENKNDGFATHTLAHVFEMEGRTSDGIQFLNSTSVNWEVSNHIANHNWWHVALYHLENEDYESTVDILEKHSLTRAMVSKTMLDIQDCSSLLFRLNMLSPSSIKVDHWNKTYELCKIHSKDHISTFNDSHFMMAYSGCDQRGSIDELLETLPNAHGDFADHAGITRPLLESIIEFRDEKFEKIVETLEPIRYHLTPIGGSNAQRDVFNLMLIVAALKSSKDKHKKLARVLVNEREGLKTTALTQRLRSMAEK